MPREILRHSDTPPTLGRLLALDDMALEQADVVLLNLAVAKGIPSLADLDIARYVGIVDDWTHLFARLLPGMETAFRKAPERWKNDIRLFRVGMLQGFLGHEIGIRYVEEKKHAAGARYTDPGDVFLHGLINARQGTCANMPALHVAMARRMAWPVSLACVGSHFISRFDDGQVVHNIEATSTHPGSFASDPDEVYVERFELPRRAVECGSDLRKLTAREMVGVFLGLRARHYADTARPAEADSSYSLARALFPCHRHTYIRAMAPMLARGTMLFNPGEVGHPDTLFEAVEPHFLPAGGTQTGSEAMSIAPSATLGMSAGADSVVDVLGTAFGFPLPAGPKASLKQEGKGP